VGQRGRGDNPQGAARHPPRGHLAGARARLQGWALRPRTVRPVPPAAESTPLPPPPAQVGLVAAIILGAVLLLDAAQPIVETTIERFPSPQ
jgi:hypothetical protein